MKGVNFCIQRPLIPFVFALLLLLVGIFSAFTIPLSLFPEFKNSSVSISINYSGASAVTVEKEITNKLVNTLKNINNVDTISANSQNGQSNIQINFKPMSDLEFISELSSINQAIQSAKLPNSASQPQINSASSFSSLVSVAIFSSKYTSFELANYAQENLFPALQAVPGVTKIRFDADSSVVRIKLNPQKLAQYGLSPTDVSKVLDDLNSSQPAGSFVINEHEFIINILSPFTSLPNIENLVITVQNPLSKNTSLEGGLKQITKVKKLIYLKNIASVSFESSAINPAAIGNYNGETAFILTAMSSKTANPFLAVNEIKKVLSEAKNTLPEGVYIKTLSDSAVTMSDSLYEVLITILVSTLLVVLICFIFLGRFRSTLIPAVTIPICLLGSIIFLSLLGFSLNMLTLLAMVLAIGLVVDDAIVVVEHISAYIEKGLSVKASVIKGTREISVTIIGITITILAVYVPIAFMQGQAAVLYQQFAAAIALCIFISGILALTLSPVMCLYLLKQSNPNKTQQLSTHVLQRSIFYYQKILTFILKYRWLTMIIFLLLILVALSGVMKLPAKVYPLEPNGSIDITLQSSPADNIDGLQRKALKIVEPFLKDKRLQYYAVDTTADAVTGKLTADITLRYKIRYLKQLNEIVSQINHYFQGSYSNLNISARLSPFVSMSGNADFVFVLLGTNNQDQVDKQAQQVIGELKQNPIFVDVDNNITGRQIQFELDVNVVKAEQLGISQQDIKAFLSTYLGGSQLKNELQIKGQNVPIIVQLDTKYLKDPKSLALLQIKSNTGKWYNIGSFVSLKTVAARPFIVTINGLPSVQISANISKGYSLKNAIEMVDELLPRIVPNLQYEYQQDAKTYLENTNSSIWVFVFGIIIIYLTLMILFNSFIDPFIILLTVPFSVVGGALSLYLVDGSFNVFSIIGLITLVGLITKHGVLIVQFANHQMAEGKSVFEAIHFATEHRFRPILMTTFAMMLGAIPLVFAGGLGYAAHQNLGIVIVFGLIVGTFFSLFVVPIVYTLLKRSKQLS